MGMYYFYISCSSIINQSSYVWTNCITNFLKGKIILFNNGGYKNVLSVTKLGILTLLIHFSFIHVLKASIKTI